MIETIRYSIDGDYDELRGVLIRAGVTGEILQYPAKCVVYVEILVGTAQHRDIEEAIASAKVDFRRYSSLEASPEELATAELFSNVGCRWVEDDEDIIDSPAYTGNDRCPACGCGAREHGLPLRVNTKKLRKYHLVRMPPSLVLGSRLLVDLIRNNGWSGVETRPVIDRSTGKESDTHLELWIQSVLPRMHTSSGIDRSPVPTFCETCHRVGFQLLSRRPVYSRSVLTTACDWNLSTEWLAPHFVPCPKLICSRRVVHELMRLEDFQRWIPVKLVDS